MSEPTTTRKALRRAIGLKAGMAFYKKYPANYLKLTAGSGTDASSCTTEKMYCTSLTQQDDVWNGWYFYLLDASTTIASGEEREITGFNSQNQYLQVEYPLSIAPADSDEFELLITWPAQQIHEEINNVILESWQVFPTVVVDERLIVQEDKLEYSTSDFAVDPAFILSIKIEQPGTIYTGYVTSGDTSGPTWVTTDFGLACSDLSTDYYWSFYYGSAAGQSGEIVSGDTDTITVTSSDLSVAPDTTTKYAIWKHTEEVDSWYPLEAVRFDQIQWPTNFYLTEGHSSYYGARLQTKYIAGNATLTADDSVTQIPKYYLVNKVLASLHDNLVGDNRKDRQMHAGIAEYYDQLAERYAQKYPKRLPPGTVWNEDQYRQGSPIENPIGW